MTSLLIRLYPARWRARYGEEFAAILEERPLGPFDVADIALGALDARLRLRGHGAEMKQRRGFSMSLRIGGFAAILGAASLVLAALLGLGLVPIDERVASALLVVGLAALLVALAGLSAFQAPAYPHLIWAAFALTAAGSLANVVGWFGSATFAGDAYWGIWFLGVLAALIGSGLFAVATYRTATLSRGAAVLVGIGSMLPIVSIWIDKFEPMIIAAIICFLLGWFGLGVQAIRLDRPSPHARPG